MYTSIIISALIINGIISAVVANAAKQRQIGSLKVFLISFLLTPILGMFITVMSPQITEVEIEEPIQSSADDGNKIALFALVIFMLFICVTVLF